MTVRCRKRPLVVLLDEAHVLERDVGQLLLNVSQEVRADAPFLLVLAGTPGLPAHLSAIDASFWSRLGEGRLGIGLLSDAATRAALVEPLAAHGVSIDANVLDAVVEDSQRYPYFVQLWGEALWKRRLTHRRDAAHRRSRAGGAVRRHRPSDRLLPGSVPRAGSVGLAGCRRAGSDAASNHADIDLRRVEVRHRGRPRFNSGPQVRPGCPDRVCSAWASSGAHPGSNRRSSTSPASLR